MNRRRLLSFTSTAVLPSLAGCQVFGGSLSSDPAAFEEVTLSGPTEVGVGERFSLSVAATNAGGESGDFTDTLTAEGSEADDTEIRIGDVAGGETRSVEVGPFSLSHAGHHRFRLAGSEAAHTVSAATQTLPGGQRFAFADGLAVSVADPAYHRALFFDAPSGREVLAAGERRDADDDSVLAVVRVWMENRTTRPIPTDPSSFAASDGAVVAALDQAADGLASLAVEGDPFGGSPLAPGDSRSGWLVADVPAERAAEGLRVAWGRARREAARDGETSSASDSQSSSAGGGERDAPDSVPEVRWQFDSADLPEFSVADLSLPAETELGTTLSASATVENVGAASGTYRAVFERRFGDETTWRTRETVELDLSPGERRTWTTEWTPPEAGRAEYRLRPGSAVETASVLAAERGFGETFTTPDGAAIRVRVGTDGFDGLLGSYIYDSGESQTYRAQKGKTFAFVRVEARNTTDEPISFPGSRRFSVAVGGESSGVFHQSSTGTTFGSPVEGPFYAPTETYDPDETEWGWLVFQVPAGTAVGDLTVRWSPSDDVGATWTK
ncbi:hypothetical protein M0R88_02610 [Halorussus gelatinilyticus]|uniref:DUF4352 domain-containing protein n=1 Tax=Halorussus gelatinilyticus TaxID=2937524 RepID=A0A8U0IK39_9EURY|nr:hypothetical protein [Halorussus gelatinilyticus]UPW01001.1 hypothetical protein M0R88_02610 [Halorussus gelatinilyticus]